MTIEEKIEVMRAFSEGKKIQSTINTPMGIEWEDDGVPSWNWEWNDYRIKPKKEKNSPITTNREPSEQLSKPWSGRDLQGTSIKETAKKNYKGIKKVNVNRMIEVMQAFAEGKKIESRSITHYEDIWRDDFNPNWNWYDLDYRIKEMPPIMTNKQLSEWLSRNKGQKSELNDGDPTFVSFVHSYPLSQENDPVSGNLVIRSWGSHDWVYPTVDIYERDCIGPCESYVTPLE